MRQVLARDLEPGDYVDLQGCEYVAMTEHPSVEFEYALAMDVKQETEQCTVVSFEGIDAFGFPSNYLFSVKE